MEVVIIVLLGIITINVIFSPNYYEDMKLMRSRLYSIQQELEDIKKELKRQGE